jgi:preprotein translocase subunit SecA
MVITSTTLKAHRLFQRDRDYIVRKAEITYRRIHGPHDAGPTLFRRAAQALEAKEHVAIQPRRLASITFQNYFRM